MQLVHKNNKNKTITDKEGARSCQSLNFEDHRCIETVNNNIIIVHFHTITHRMG